MSEGGREREEKESWERGERERERKGGSEWVSEWEGGKEREWVGSERGRESG